MTLLCVVIRKSATSPYHWAILVIWNSLKSKPCNLQFALFKFLHCWTICKKTAQISDEDSRSKFSSDICGTQVFYSRIYTIGHIETLSLSVSVISGEVPQPLGLRQHKLEWYKFSKNIKSNLLDTNVWYMASELCNRYILMNDLYFSWNFSAFYIEPGWLSVYLYWFQWGKCNLPQQDEFYAFFSVTQISASKQLHSCF